MLTHAVAVRRRRSNSQWEELAAQRPSLDRETRKSRGGWCVLPLHFLNQRLAVKQYTRKKLGLLILLALLAIRWVILPLKTSLFGDGFCIRGGMVGAVVDGALGQLAKRRPRNLIDSTVVYPLVTERKRRQKVLGYSHFLEELLKRHQHDEEANYRPPKHHGTSQPLTVAVVASIELADSIGAPKQNFRSLLMEQRCRPGWLCQRCLCARQWGSLNACSSVCPSCYSDLLCDDASPSTTSIKGESLRLQVHTTQVSASHIVPRIIHQEFHEPVLAWRYPELNRFQNAWRATGWEYRFYTPTMARSFVARHFPPVVLEVYDRLALKHRQSDLFRLLILLKEGGVYANIDLLLETNLDTLLANNIGFLAARDNSNDGSRDHCLWNGLLAAQAGHPFIARAVERIVMAGAHQWEKEDVEASICSARWTPLWKSRAASWQDNTSGSCVLGMAVQSMFSKEPLTGFRLGELHVPNHGAGLILMTSSDDTGAFRCTDVDRNLLVASTKQLGLTSERMRERAIDTWLRSR